MEREIFRRFFRETSCKSINKDVPMSMTKERLLKLSALMLVGSALTLFPIVWMCNTPDIIIVFAVLPAAGACMQALALGLLRGYCHGLKMLGVVSLLGLAAGWAAPLMVIKYFGPTYLACLLYTSPSPRD